MVMHASDYEMFSGNVVKQAEYSMGSDLRGTGRIPWKMGSNLLYFSNMSQSIQKYIHRPGSSNR